MSDVAIVTGATGAIGADIARALSCAGYQLVVSGRRVEKLEALRSELRDAVAIAGDVALEETWDALLSAVGSRRIGALVHVAGGYGEPVSFASLSLTDFRRSLDANLTSTFLAMHTVVPRMCEQKHGVVVTFASTAGQIVQPMNPSAASPAYCAAKAGVLMLTRQCARESARYGVRVSAVAPGPVHNEAMERVPGTLERIGQFVPLGRVGEPTDVTRAVMYLVGAPWVTGETLSVNGGLVML